MEPTYRNLKIGDRCIFHFSTHPAIEGVVLHMPQDTGDSWIVQKLGGYQKWYIQQFDYMEVLTYEQER
jgi:hypothetical protein